MVRHGQFKTATDISTFKPKFSGEDKKGGVVEIDFNLANPARRARRDVNMYNGRKGDSDFKFLGYNLSYFAAFFLVGFERLTIAVFFAALASAISANVFSMRRTYTSTGMLATNS